VESCICAFVLHLWRKICALEISTFVHFSCIGELHLELHLCIEKLQKCVATVCVVVCKVVGLVPICRAIWTIVVKLHSRCCDGSCFVSRAMGKEKGEGTI
jgi:hypothetical protein